MLFIPDSQWLVGPRSKYGLASEFVFSPHPILFPFLLASPKDSSEGIEYSIPSKVFLVFYLALSPHLLVVTDV